VIAIFLLLINIFQIKSESLHAETRFLYTDEALKVSSNFYTTIEVLQGYSDSYRIFGILSDQPDIRVFYSNDLNSWSPPLYTGRFFNEINTNEAVVGNSVSAADEYILFLGVPYRIIGRLGVSGTKLLDNTIILNNTLLFTEANTSYLIVEGENTANAISNYLPSEPFFWGFDQLQLDVDFISPIVIFWGKLLAFISSGVFAFFYFDQKKNLLRTIFIIGKSIIKQCTQLLIVFLFYFIPYLFLLIISLMVPSIQVNLHQYSYDIIIILVISSGSFLLSGFCFSFKNKNVMQE